MNEALLVLIVSLLVLLLLSLLKLERLIKFTFGCYTLLGFNLSLGTFILNQSQLLSRGEPFTFLGLSTHQYADFLINAQPTIILILSILLLRFFVQYSHLSIQTSSQLIENRLQTVLWTILSGASFLTFLFFSLKYFNGILYQRLFENPVLLNYIEYIPIIGIRGTIFSIFFASKFPLRLKIGTTPTIEN